ncbi:MAG: hypothetical protein ACT4OP_06510 [Actinomycetota bacterium]
MSIIRSLAVFANGTLLRLGVAAAGRSLASMVGSGDEQASTLAGMMLVKAGPRSVPVVVDALRGGSEEPALATILGDLGGPEAEAELRRLAATVGGPLGQAARRSLDDLERIRRLPPDV